MRSRGAGGVERIQDLREQHAIDLAIMMLRIWLAGFQLHLSSNSYC